MNTPLVSTTTASSHRTTRPTAYERMLAIALTIVLAVVATLAFLAPSRAEASLAGNGGPASTVRIALGKATVLSSSTYEHVDHDADARL